MDLLQPWSDLDPNPFLKTFILLPWWPEPNLAICIEAFAKSSYQKMPRQQWGLNLQSLECRSKLLRKYTVVKGMAL